MISGLRNRPVLSSALRIERISSRQVEALKTHTR
jgi:hypothetical protein